MTTAAIILTALDTLDSIEATSSKLEKQALLKDGIAQNPSLLEMCQYAYNPLLTFGIKVHPYDLDDTTYTGAQSIEAMWGEAKKVLNALASRSATGAAAEDLVNACLHSLDANGRTVLRRIINKDLRAGFGDSTINKVAPKSIPTFPYMRCSLPKDSNPASWDWALPHIMQLKADGMFANLTVGKDGGVWMTSRAGSSIPMDKMPELTNFAMQLPRDTQYHGEIVVIDRATEKALPREEGNGMLNSIISGDGSSLNAAAHYIKYLAWDMIPYSVVEQQLKKFATPYKQRLVDLINSVRAAATVGPAKPMSVIETRVVNTYEDAFAYQKELTSRGEEGGVLKRWNAHWKDGTSKDQVKFKITADCDLEVLEVLPGEVGTKIEGRPGKLRCGTSDRLLEVSVTVKNEGMRDQLEANPGVWIGKIIPVCFNDITLPGENNPLHSLFLPRMLEAAYRTDKSEADSLQRVIDQLESAKTGGGK